MRTFKIRCNTEEKERKQWSSRDRKRTHRMQCNTERRRFGRKENAHTLGCATTKRKGSLIVRERVCVMAKGKERAFVEGREHAHP